MSGYAGTFRVTLRWSDEKPNSAEEMAGWIRSAIERFDDIESCSVAVIHAVEWRTDFPEEQ